MLSVRHEVPKLLGYRCSSMLMLEAQGTSLCAVSLDEEAEKMHKESYKGLGFENEFLIDQSSIVRFPTSLGLTGLAF